jgi:hypothetical protein
MGKCPLISTNSKKVWNISLLPIGSHRKVIGIIPYDSDYKIDEWSYMYFVAVSSQPFALLYDSPCPNGMSVCDFIATHLLTASVTLLLSIHSPYCYSVVALLCGSHWPYCLAACDLPYIRPMLLLRGSDPKFKSHYSILPRVNFSLKCADETEVAPSGSSRYSYDFYSYDLYSYDQIIYVSIFLQKICWNIEAF